MPEPNTSSAATAATRSVAKVAALGNVVLGCSVLICWWWDLRLLEGATPALSSMSPACALMLLLLGLSLWAVLPYPRSAAQRARFRSGQCLAFLAATLGNWTLADCLFGVNGTNWPRMPFPAAISSVGLGLSVVLLNVSFRVVCLAECVAVMTGSRDGAYCHAFSVSDYMVSSVPRHTVKRFGS